MSTRTIKEFQKQAKSRLALAEVKLRLAVREYDDARAEDDAFRLVQDRMKSRNFAQQNRRAR